MLHFVIYDISAIIRYINTFDPTYRQRNILSSFISVIKIYLTDSLRPEKIDTDVTPNMCLVSYYFSINSCKKTNGFTYIIVRAFLF